MYLDWEAKVDHIFHVYKVQDDHKLRIVSLHFLDYAKEWWHQTLRHIGYNKRPLVVSWNDLKECMRARFVSPSRKEHLLKFQRLSQGHRTVDEYFKDFETTLTKMNMHARKPKNLPVSTLNTHFSGFNFNLYLAIVVNSSSKSATC